MILAVQMSVFALCFVTVEQFVFHVRRRQALLLLPHRE